MLAPRTVWRMALGVTMACLSGASVGPGLSAADTPAPATAAVTAAPLHQRIDQAILATAKSPPASLCSDEEFVRRIHLDLAGRIPTLEETRRFLDDKAADKRARLIESLLNGPDYPRRMQEWLHVQWLERRGESAEWSDYLRRSFAENKPYDQLVREVLNPQTNEEATRASAYFLTKRLENYGQNPVDLPRLTRDVGRLFMGVDLQCAQCHDHPHVRDYSQADYQGLFAFVGHTYIRKDVKFPAVGENLVAKKTEYSSVFVRNKEQIGPKLRGGTEVEIPTFEKGMEWVEAPNRAKNFQGTPKFSPLGVLSQQLPSGEYAPFARTAANRFWFFLMGRGLVHPLDWDHAANPPSHPELLKLLAEEFRQSQFNIKTLLREIALSDTYQRSSRLPTGTSEFPKPESFLVALEKPLSAEQLLWSMLHATGEVQKFAAAAEKAESGKPKADGVKADGVKGEVAKNPEGVDKLLDRFRGAFANPALEPEVEYLPSVKAALFLRNDDVVLSWLKPQPGNLVERLLKTESAEAVADDLYLSLLSRPPTAVERAEVVQYLRERADRREKALGQLVWSLLASTEFAMNH